jgi:hypothetical protein
MVYQLAILVVIPILFGILITSPFESPVEEEPIEVIPQEPNINYLYIILGIFWLFILIRMLNQIMKGRYRFGYKI